MSSPDPASPGFVTSLRVLGDSLLGTVQERIELLTVELAAEKFRLIQIGFWMSAAVFAGVMAATFGSLTLVFLFWDTARLTVLASFAVLYSVGLTAILVGFRRYLARQPKPFASTLDEIKQDRACLQEKP